MGQDPIRIIYIMGSSKSGSTILGGIFGMHPSTFNGGELVQLGLKDDPMGESICSCGQKVGECPLWSDVYEEWLHAIHPLDHGRYRELVDKFERIRSYYKLLQSSIHASTDFQEYAHQTSTYFRTLAKKTGKTTIVDTSKYPMRALALSRIPGFQVQVVHLVRDARGVLRHVKRKQARIGRNLSGVHGWRLAIWKLSDWYLVHRLALRISKVESLEYSQIRYEDYASEPIPVFKDLCADIGLSFSDIEGAITFPTGQISFKHEFGGNHVRLRSPQTLFFDEDWRGNLTTFEKLAYWTIAGRLGRDFGYH